MKKQPVKQPVARKTTAKPQFQPFVKHDAPHFPNWVYAVIIAFCFALYSNTLSNEFALDDTMVLTQNEFVKQGVSGITKIFKYDTFIGRYGEQVTNLPGGRYRPLSVALLALEYDIFVSADVKQIIKDKLDTSKTQYTIAYKYLSNESQKQLDNTRNNELAQLNQWRISTFAQIDTLQHPQAAVDINNQYNEVLSQINSRASAITYTKAATALKQNDDDAPLYMKTLLPYVSHFVNMLLFALTCCFLFKLLWRLFPVRNAGGWKLLFNIPVIATLLFIAHPVHVEAIANIKGRDEIMTFLGALMALFYTIRWLDTRDWKYLAITFVCFLAGAFSKENALTLLVIIPLTMYFFGNYKLKHVLFIILFTAIPVFLLLKGYFIQGSLRPHASSLLVMAMLLAIVPLLITAFSKSHSKLRELSFAILPSFLAALIFIVVRYSIIVAPVIANVNAHGVLPPEETELMNNPFLYMTGVEKWASIIYVLGQYLRLLIYPHPLTTDYYPYYIPKVIVSGVEPNAAINTIGLFNMSIFLPLLIYIGLMAFAVWGMASSRKNKYVYAIIWYLVPLSIVSNVFVMIGTFMNERFIYISSVGFSLAVAYFLIQHVPQWVKDARLYRYGVVGLLAVVLCLYSVQTVSRNKIWHDDFTLSTTDAKTSTTSAKANYDAARVYNIKIQPVTDPASRDSITRQIYYYSKRATDIHPAYENALLLYSWSNSVLGSQPYAAEGVQVSLADSIAKYPIDESRRALVQLLRRNPQNPYAYDGLTFVMQRMPAPAQRAEVWEEVLRAAPERFEPNYNLACIYGKEMNDLTKAAPFFEKAAQVNPQNANALIDLGYVYAVQGNKVKALELFRRAAVVAPNEPLAWQNLEITYRELGDVQRANEVHQHYATLMMNRQQQ